MRISTMPKKIILLLLAITIQAAAFAPTNFFPPYAPTFRLPVAPEGRYFGLGANLEWGEARRGRNWDSKKSNVLQLYDDTQSAIAMFEQATVAVNTPEFRAVRDALRILGARDDGIRGHVRLAGKFEQFDVTPHFQYMIPLDLCSGNFALSIALPIRHARIDGVRFEDLTTGLTCADVHTQELLTASLAQLNLQTKLFGSLSLDNWSDTGLGDLLLKFEWFNNYPQEKESLQNVELHAFVALSCPTGKKRDEDRAFSFAFGNDGAWSLPFGLGIDLDFEHCFAMGAEAQFEVIFDHTKVRRMKTEEHQTEFLLLNKGRASKDYGLTWKFYLYMQGYHFWRGLSLRGAYEYVKHDSDSLSPKDNVFDSAVVNTARSLNEWNMHHIIVQLNYDCFKEFKCSFVVPQMSFFVKIPVGGKGIINPYTVGGQLAFNF